MVETAKRTGPLPEGCSHSRSASRARSARNCPAGAGEARSGPTTAKRNRAHRSRRSLASLLFIVPSLPRCFVEVAMMRRPIGA